MVNINDIPKLEYKVLCRTITYNHAPYIEDAMNGFVMQQTNFPFVCFIIDDASTDGEPDVIKKYLNQNFQMDKAEFYELELADVIVARHNTNTNCTFAIYLLKRNLFKEPDIKNQHSKPWTDRCNYIAICEGDDYWIDPLKLQKQVDILEADQTLMGCCTNRKLVDSKGNTLKDRLPHMIQGKSSCRITLRDYFQYNTIYPTASVLYRNTHKEEVSQKKKHMRNPYLGDWTMWIALHCFGDFYYLDEVTTAYRINPTSVTHTQWVKHRVDKVKNQFDLLPHVADVLPLEYEDIAADLRNTNWVYGALAKAYYKDKKYLKMLWTLCIVAVKNPHFYISIINKAMHKTTIHH